MMGESITVIGAPEVNKKNVVAALISNVNNKRVILTDGDLQLDRDIEQYDIQVIDSIHENNQLHLAHSNSQTINQTIMTSNKLDAYTFIKDLTARLSIQGVKEFNECFIQNVIEVTFDDRGNQVISNIYKIREGSSWFRLDEDGLEKLFSRAVNGYRVLSAECGENNNDQILHKSERQQRINNFRQMVEDNKALFEN